MKTVPSLLLLCILLTSAHSFSLNPLEISEDQKNGATLKQLASLISESQPETMRKALLHFLEQEIESLQGRETPKSIKEKISNWFKPESIAAKNEQLNRFIRSKLFYRLEMGKLSESFKKEIDNSPELYFLTFDMYDLLIDE